MKQKILASSLGFALIASTVWIPSQKARAISFNPPPDSGSPSSATGGASRGGLFVPKSGESAPSRATGGASRGLFESNPDSSAPSRATGGASRGLFESDPDSSAPNRATGGASRGLFESDPDSSAPSSATGGASRGLFESDPDNSAPKQATGGASRGELFDSDSEQPAPNGATVGGASRDGRHYLKFPGTATEQPAAILALLPQTYFGTTVSQRPEILVYVPKSQARESVFSLKDAQGNTLHQMSVPVSGKAGIISIKVPVTLELEKNYQWFLALKIDGQLTARTPYVDGWVKRVKPNREIAALMQQKDLFKQAEAFGKHGHWYDCVSTLAKLQATQPTNTNLNKHWTELLESVELQQIEKAPMLAFN